MPPALTSALKCAGLKKQQQRLKQLKHYQQLPLTPYAEQPRFPFESYIRLRADWRERHAVMLALRDAKVRNARRYGAERTVFVDASAPFSGASHFVSAAGDMCALRVEVVPFEGVASVQQVFDALLFYVANMEISATEALGDVTVRDGEERQGVTQNRLVSSMVGDTHVEFNAIVFYSLSRAVEGDGGVGVTSSSGGDVVGDKKDASAGGDVGVIVANYVSEDALYPHRPECCLRYDTVAGITVELQSRAKKKKRKKTAVADKSGGDGESATAAAERIVVVKRTALLRLRRTDLPVAPHVMHALRERLESWGDVVLETVRGILYPRRVALSA